MRLKEEAFVEGLMANASKKVRHKKKNQRSKTRGKAITLEEVFIEGIDSLCMTKLCQKKQRRKIGEEEKNKIRRRTFCRRR